MAPKRARVQGRQAQSKKACLERPCAVPCPGLLLDLPDPVRTLLFSVLSSSSRLALLRTSKALCTQLLTEEPGLRVMIRMGLTTSASLARVLTLARKEPFQGTVFLMSGLGNFTTAEEILAGACINDAPTPRAVRHWRRTAGLGIQAPLIGLRRLVLQSLRLPIDILPPSLIHACPHLTNLMLDSCVLEAPLHNNPSRSRAARSLPPILPSLRILSVRTSRYESKWSLQQLGPLLHRLPSLSTLCLGPFGTGIPEDTVANLPTHVTHLELDIRLAVHARQNWLWSEGHVAALVTNKHLRSLHLIGASTTDRYSSMYAPTALAVAQQLTALRSLQLPDELSDVELTAALQLRSLTSLAVGGFRELTTSFADCPCSLKQLQVGQQITFAQLARLPLANLSQPLRLDSCSVLPQHCVGLAGHNGMDLDHDEVEPDLGAFVNQVQVLAEAGADVAAGVLAAVVAAAGVPMPQEPAMEPAALAAAVAAAVVAAPAAQQAPAAGAGGGGPGATMLAEVQAAAANLARCGGAVAHDLTLQLATHPDWNEHGAVAWHDSRVAQALQALLPNIKQLTGTLTLCSLVMGGQSVQALKLLDKSDPVAHQRQGKDKQQVDGAQTSEAGTSSATGVNSVAAAAAFAPSGAATPPAVSGSMGPFGPLYQHPQQQQQVGSPELQSLCLERCFVGRGALPALRDLMMKGGMQGVSSLHLVENNIADESEVCTLCEGWWRKDLNPKRRGLTIYLSQEDEFPSTQEIAAAVELLEDPGITTVETCDNGCHLRVELMGAPQEHTYNHQPQQQLQLQQDMDLGMLGLMAGQGIAFNIM